MNNKRILDPCCGSRMMWFDKENPNVIFGDYRRVIKKLCDGRELVVSPDVDLDFRNLPFENESFYLVCLDPPHLVKAGDKSWLANKYGKLTKDWRSDIRKGLSECFRVLKPNGILVFKWNETQIKCKEVLSLTDKKPLFGHPTNRSGTTHWFTFMKD